MNEEALKAARLAFDHVRIFGGNAVEETIAAYLAALPKSENDELIARLRSIDVDDDHDLYENAMILKEAAAALESTEARAVEAEQRAGDLCDALALTDDRLKTAKRQLAAAREALRSLAANCDSEVFSHWPDLKAEVDAALSDAPAQNGVE